MSTIKERRRWRNEWAPTRSELISFLAELDVFADPVGVQYLETRSLEQLAEMAWRCGFLPPYRQPDPIYEMRCAAMRAQEGYPVPQEPPPYMRIFQNRRPVMH